MWALRGGPPGTGGLGFEPKGLESHLRKGLGFEGGLGAGRRHDGVGVSPEYTCKRTRTWSSVKARCLLFMK